MKQHNSDSPAFSLLGKGLTKREYLAAAALHAWVSHPEQKPEEIAEMAVSTADQVLHELKLKTGYPDLNKQDLSFILGLLETRRKELQSLLALHAGSPGVTDEQVLEAKRLNRLCSIITKAL